MRLRCEIVRERFRGRQFEVADNLAPDARIDNRRVGPPGHHAQLRRRHHRRGPQRPDVRGLSRHGRAQGQGAGAPAGGGRRGGDRGVSSGLSQLGRRLHGEPAQSEDHRRSAPRSSTGCASSSAARRTSCLRRTGRICIAAEGRTEREIAKFSARDAERYGAFNRQLDACADVLRELVLAGAAEPDARHVVRRARRTAEGRPARQPAAPAGERRPARAL